ncbi:hypothetical protein IWX81_000082 [Salinibacterium sp. CAN_S4]|uniref:AAA family ATPase n=1 Tax=Salinibacterium sp. CAN_S4 TaxID=2787727 RepID=UPI0018EFDD7F
MIFWINGPFGAGKTTLANLMVQRMPNAHFIDTERIGYLLNPVLSTLRPVQNFQDWPAWRALVVTYLTELHEELGGTLIVPQSVFVEAYWAELREGLADLPVRAITLNVPVGELERRIRSDEIEAGSVNWRLERIDDYVAALPWLRRETDIVDASLPAHELADALSSR